MKIAFLGAVLCVCTSSTIASAKTIDGCEVIRISGSNAYYRADENCEFGAGAKDTRIKVSVPANPGQVDPIDETPIEVALPVEVENPIDADPVFHPEPTDEAGGESEAEVPVGEVPVDPVSTDEPAIEEPTPTDEPVVVDEGPAPSPDEDKGPKKDDHDRGHGNDADGVDDDNTGQSTGVGGPKANEAPATENVETAQPDKDTKETGKPEDKGGPEKKKP